MMVIIRWLKTTGPKISRCGGKTPLEVLGFVGRAEVAEVRRTRVVVGWMDSRIVVMGVVIDRGDGVTVHSRVMILLAGLSRLQFAANAYKF
jgi:hypothetical protein